MELVPTLSVWLALCAGASDVTLSRERLVTLQPESAAPPEASPGALVVERTLRLDPVGSERVDLGATWRVVVTRPTPVTWALAGPGVEVTRIAIDGHPVSVTQGPDGSTVLSTLLDRTATISIAGTVRGDPGSGAEIRLLEAGTGTVELPPAFVAEGAVWVGPGRAVGAPARIRLVPAPARSEQGTLAFAETALGFTVGEAELRVAGRIRWRIARGSLDRVGFSVPGAGPDLVVTGPQVASFSRSGDRVEVVLRAPERALVALEFGWSAPVPAGETGTLSVPDVHADGVFRTTSALQIARDGQVDLVPTLVGWQATAPSSLPEWARSLVQGVPTASYLGQGGGGTVSVFRFTPAESPATLVDTAAFTLATTDEGRILMRAHYAVRNDRGATLRITPPPGLVPIGARVGGEVADVAREGDDWLVPLEKSVETVEGLLSFPVEVNFLGEVGAWSRRERRTVVLPVVDVEVAVSRVTLYLPPGYRGRVRPGRGDAVEAFTEGQGITYGFAVGDARAAQADVLFQEAVDAWMSNAFDETTAKLDQLEQMGASNQDIGRLRSNIEVIEAKPAQDATGGSAGVAMERRVLEQARARSDDDARLQEEELEKAEQARASGDYAEAEASYSKALEVGNKLAKLHTEEDRSQAEANAAVQGKLEAVREVSKQKADSMVSQSSGKPGGTDLTADDGKVAAGEAFAGWGDPEAPTTPEAEEIEVADADAEPVGTEGSLAGQLVAGDLVENIPVGRSYESVLQSVPGIAAGSGGRKDRTGDRGGEPVTGATTNENLYVLDGEATSATSTTRAPSPIVPPARSSRGPDDRKRGEAASDAPMAAVADPMAVTAASSSVVIPTLGDDLFYQRLLLPAGTRWEVPVTARKLRRNR